MDSSILYWILYIVISLVLLWLSLSLILIWVKPELYDSNGNLNWWNTLWVSALLILFVWVMMFLFTLILRFFFSLKDDSCGPCAKRL